MNGEVTDILFQQLEAFPGVLSIRFTMLNTPQDASSNSK